MDKEYLNCFIPGQSSLTLCLLHREDLSYLILHCLLSQMPTASLLSLQNLFSGSSGCCRCLLGTGYRKRSPGLPDTRSDISGIIYLLSSCQFLLFLFNSKFGYSLEHPWKELGLINVSGNGVSSALISSLV